jgi:GNAT superfamily N-acetyltransferase
LEIFKASEEDLNELTGLFRRYMEYHRQIDEYFSCKRNASELWTKYMKGVLQDENQIVCCAVTDGKIVGYITGKIRNRAPVYRIEKVGLIGDAYVLPEHRRKKVFTQLLDEILHWMRKKEVEYVEHPVASKNKLGSEVWRKSGFEDSLVFMRKKI